MQVLAGDFMLARASVCLSRLRNIPVVELLSSVIEHLVRSLTFMSRPLPACMKRGVAAAAAVQVKGEVMQMRGVLRNEGASRAALEAYLRKS